MIRYRGALYNNIWLKNGYRGRDASLAFADVDDLHEAIFKAVYYNENFRNEDRNVFELTDKGWVLL